MNAKLLGNKIFQGDPNNYNRKFSSRGSKNFIKIEIYFWRYKYFTIFGPGKLKIEVQFSRDSTCQKVVGDELLCDDNWDAFTSAFKFKDPDTIINEDYNGYFDFIPIVSAPG